MCASTLLSWVDTSLPEICLAMTDYHVSVLIERGLMRKALSKNMEFMGERNDILWLKSYRGDITSVITTAVNVQHRTFCRMDSPSIVVSVTLAFRRVGGKMQGTPRVKVACEVFPCRASERT